MKTIKQMYLAMTEHGVVISDDVTYLENGVYLVKDATTVPSVSRTVPDCNLCKLDESNLTQLVKLVHRAVYLESDTLPYDMRTFDRSVLSTLESMQTYPYSSKRTFIPIIFYSGGMIRLSGHDETDSILTCEEDILTAEYVTFVRRGGRCFVIKACDEKGTPICDKTRTRSANPYSRNCNIVYNIVAKNPGINTFDIIATLGWGDTGRVTPRLSELAKGGRIRVLGKEYNPESKRSISTWIVNEYE